MPAVVGQPGLTLDDGTGLRVAQSRFVGDQKFTWQLFAGFTSCRILTYSVDLRTVNRLIVDFDEIECIIGTTATINRIEKVLAAQHAAMHSAKVLIDDVSKTESLSSKPCWRDDWRSACCASRSRTPSCTSSTAEVTRSVAS